MNFDYDELLSEMDKRKFGTDRLQRIVNEEYALKRFDSAAYESFNKARQYQFLQVSSVVKYIIGAMLPVSEKYTRQIISCRDRVENVLKQMNENTYRSAPLEFKYQGSVSNNTHIRHNSDVDLLTITGNFITLEYPQRPQKPYLSNPIDDLKLLRENCVNQIQKVMPSVKVDDNGAKSIALTGGSLVVKVDVVPANWFESNKYAETKNPIYKGIQIYDKKQNKRILNYPFWFNELLKQKDASTGGVFKRAVRLLKSIKADMERIDNEKISFSSYGISSLLYSVSNFKYQIGESPLTLLKVVNEALSYYAHAGNYGKLTDPIGEPLNSNSNTISGIRKLQSDTSQMISDIGEDIDRIIKIA